MDMVQTEKLVFEYEKRDEEGNVIGEGLCNSTLSVRGKKK